MDREENHHKNRSHMIKWSYMTYLESLPGAYPVIPVMNRTKP
jgi:hypothetical protein